MTHNAKLGFVLMNCSFNHADGLYIDTENIVGTMAARAFRGENELECVTKVVEYFDKEIQSDKDTLVRTILKNIGWTKPNQNNIW